MRILYVEDHEELRETIGMLMEGEGRSVVLCESAEQGLAQDSKDPFDMVVTDVSLPGLSGTEFAHQLLAKNPARWVVLCSGYELGTHAQAWGPNVRTLLKPFEVEQLDALLQEVELALASGRNSVG
ncbi:response regulator [Simplicispira suum]|uniref:Response regulator n=1 Tax=Simplicispira suum TaxID=2109915 RepID=A0A2S0MY44_9BURK|nr:response regulator [Simplicispira suum]AVO40812.1 response regulator [Simplicispira suum]MBW7834745.1 response regulator [Simplicispira suum]